MYTSQLTTILAFTALPLAALSKPMPTPTPATAGSGTITVFEAHHHHHPHGAKPSGTTPPPPTGTGTHEKPTPIGYIDASGKLTTTEGNKGTFTIDASSIKTTAGTCGFSGAATAGKNGTEILGAWGCGSGVTGGQLTINFETPPAMMKNTAASQTPPTFLVFKDSAQTGMVKWSVKSAAEGAELDAMVVQKKEHKKGDMDHKEGDMGDKEHMEHKGEKKDFVPVELVWEKA